ncbi:hypothetical protein DFH28DRAFT_945777 [Melampsora americana]|nr:hypothetical protein DFH28DRAFT_945777 [Melampsora americana]
MHTKYFMLVGFSYLLLWHMLLIIFDKLSTKLVSIFSLPVLIVSQTVFNLASS